MDHLPQPPSPAVERMRVPYVCTESYDGGDFMTYPNRAGWPQVLPSAEYPEFSKYESMYPSDDRELEKFFQSWIFFGLLNELLSEENLYNKDEYLETVDGVRYVHTKNLVARLNEWERLVKQWEQKMKSERYERLVKCLYLAEDSIKVLSQEPKRGVLVPDRKHAGFNKAVKRSLLALCETVMVTVNEALLEKPEDGRSPGGFIRIGWDLDLEMDMKRNGWCPSEIGYFSRTFRTISAQTYAHAMRRPNRGLLHSDCTGDTCEELQVKAGTYRTGHRCESRECGFLGPDMVEVLRIIEAGDIPILRIKGSSPEDIIIKVLPHGQLPFVALSHVWVDGLGNEHANELPRCQLFRLLSLLDQLHGHTPWSTDATEDRELFLWCDTLCCPVVNAEDELARKRQKEAKKLVITGMRDVYAKATYVLVLDFLVQHASYSESGVVVCAFSLFTSGWMQRLWTFQEAVLAKSLQFSDRAVDLRTIEDDVKPLLNSGVAFRAIAIDLTVFCRTLRLFFHSTSSTVTPDLANIATSIRSRRVSKQADEPLCLGSALQLEIGKIVDATEDTAEQRMCGFWRALPAAPNGIPVDVSFTTMRRLRTKGYRWAPASLQESFFSTPQLEVRTQGNERPPATLTLNGLLAKLPAWRIRVESPHPDMPSTLWPGSQMVGNNIHVRHPDGTWFWINRHWPTEYPVKATPDKPLPGEDLASPNTAMWDLLADTTKTLYLILEEELHTDGSRWGGQTRGIIAQLDHAEDGTKVAKSLLVSVVKVAPPNEATLWQAAYDRAMALRQERFYPPNLDDKAFSRVMVAAQKALQEERQLAAAVHSAATGRADMFLGLMIAMKFMGRFAVIEETFGPETEWCID